MASDKILEESICVHIFTVSAAMVGVCLTVIGLLRVIITLNALNTLADDLLALDSFLSLSSCLFAYWALRMRTIRRMHRIERPAAGVFILGLLVMVATYSVITYGLISDFFTGFPGRMP
jgi:hypothetical protein